MGICVTQQLLPVLKHSSLTSKVGFKCSRGRCIWDWYFPLISRAIKQVLTSHRAHTFSFLFLQFLTPQVSRYGNWTVEGGSRDSVVDIATRYGSNSGGCEIFLVCPDRPWGPPSILYNGYRVCTGGKQTGRGVDHPPSSSAEVKERVELYLYSTSGPTWPVLGWYSSLL